MTKVLKKKYLENILFIFMSYNYNNSSCNVINVVIRYTKNNDRG